MNVHTIPTGEPEIGTEFFTRLGQRVRFVSESRYGEWIFRVVGSREELTLAPHYVQRWLREVAVQVPE